MTLNITLVTNSYIIQASDRRMVQLPEGKPIDDEANKGLILRADDGIFAVTFAGVGLYGGERVDLWLAKCMLDQGVPELPIREGIDIIARSATDWFSTFAEDGDKRHAFVVAGWEGSETKARPAVWNLTNYLAADGIRRLDRARKEFDVREHGVHRVAGGMIYLEIGGLHDAVARSDRRRLVGALKKSAHVNSAEQAIVQTIRAAAAKPRWTQSINGNVLATALVPDGRVRATYHPASAPAFNYAPVLIWYEAGQNFCVADAQADPIGNVAWRFGQAMLVQPPGGERARSDLPASEQFKIKFRLRTADAKHKKEPIGQVPILQPVPLPPPGPGGL